MNYKSKQIKGKGRGKLLGSPTINLEIPSNFTIQEGIYAVYVWIKYKKYKGALHFGPVPVFNETNKSLEVFLIDAIKVPDTSKEEITFEIVKKIRDIQMFQSPEILSKQIADDVKRIQKLLH